MFSPTILEPREKLQTRASSTSQQLRAFKLLFYTV